MQSLKLTFVVATNDRSILQKNLLSSPCLLGRPTHQLLLREEYSSAALAYNSALDLSTNEIVAFVHQDVFLPEGWIADVTSALESLEATDPAWGVIGACGITEDRSRLGYLFTPGEGVIGQPSFSPARVRVLDELVLIMRKSSGLMFDPQLPGFHFYGTDLCLQAAARGLNSYAISAFCIHNSCQYFEYPPEFYTSYRYVKRRWQNSLPIHTPCISASRFDRDMWKRRVKRAIAFVSGRSLQRGPRIDDPTIILKQIQSQAGL
jgi:hypothetical protein